MTREIFLSEMKRALGRLPEGEKKDILADFEEHFRIGTGSGRSEEQVAEALGNPRIIGKSFLIDSLLEEGREGRRAGPVLRALLASLGLGLLNIVVVLAPFLVFVAILLDLWAAAGGLALAAVAALVGLAIQPFIPGVDFTAGMNVAFLVFGSIGVSALGVLCLLGMWRLTRWFIFSVAKYVQFNLRIITNRR
jgi:uncharacterized membrane protein